MTYYGSLEVFGICSEIDNLATAEGGKKYLQIFISRDGGSLRNSLPTRFCQPSFQKDTGEGYKDFFLLFKKDQKRFFYGRRGFINLASSDDSS